MCIISIATDLCPNLPIICINDFNNNMDNFACYLLWGQQREQVSSTSRFDVYFIGIISSSFLLIFIAVKQDFLTYKLKRSLKDTSGFWGKVNNIYIFFL